MKAFLIEGKCSARIAEIEKPVPKDDEVLIEVKAVGLCGTDIHIYKGEYLGNYPYVPGHEFSGIVSGLGKNVTRFKIGQHVSADPNIFCETCDECKRNKQNYCEDIQGAGVTRFGGMAEYVVVPERCVFDITGLDFTVAALVEPLACAVYGAERVRALTNIASNVLIIGSGTIGLMHLQLAKMSGAASVTVTDLFEEKLKFAKKLGADYVYLSPEFEKLGKTNGYDLVIDCTGLPQVVENSVKYVRDSGVFLLFGVCPNDSVIRLNPYEIFKREITITSSYALKKTFGKALALAQNGKIDLASLVGQRVALDDAQGAFDSMMKGSEYLKTVIYPGGM